MGFIGLISPRYKFTGDSKIRLCDSPHISMDNDDYGKLLVKLLTDVNDLKQGKQK